MDVYKGGGVRLGGLRLRKNERRVGRTAGGSLPAVPVNTVAPVASGAVSVGSVLSVTNGTWTNSPSGYAYQWYRDGAAVGGATSSTYTLVSGDSGAMMTAQVTATNAAGPGSALSNVLGPVTSSSYTPSLDYSNSLNSMYLGAGF